MVRRPFCIYNIYIYIVYTKYIYIYIPYDNVDRVSYGVRYLKRFTRKRVVVRGATARTVILGAAIIREASR